MIEMLRRILDVHGGLDRWNGYNKVEATIVSGGGFLPLKGVLQDRSPRRMTVWLHEQRSSVFPYGSADQCSVVMPERIAIEKKDGRLVAERRAPKDSFAGHQMSTHWDALIVLISTARRFGTILRRPFFSRWMVYTGRKRRPGVRVQRVGTCCVLTFLVQSRPTVRFRIFSSVTTSCCAATTMP